MNLSAFIVGVAEGAWTAVPERDKNNTRTLRTAERAAGVRKSRNEVHGAIKRSTNLLRMLFGRSAAKIGPQGVVMPNPAEAPIDCEKAAR